MSLFAWEHLGFGSKCDSGIPSVLGKLRWCDSTNKGMYPIHFLKLLVLPVPDQDNCEVVQRYSIIFN